MSRTRLTDGVLAKAAHPLLEYMCHRMKVAYGRELRKNYDQG